MNHSTLTSWTATKLRCLALAAVLLASLGVLAALLPQTAQAQATERQRSALVKAAFLHKFFSFVEWPDGTFARPDTPVRIGVIGDDEILADLQELAKDRARDGRPVTVVKIAPTEAPGGVHILYIRQSSAARMADTLSAVPEGVLTVADADSAHPKGSVMSFFLEDDRVRFGVSIEAAVRQRLRLNSRLLSVARKIQGALDLPSLFAAVGRSLSDAALEGLPSHEAWIVALRDRAVEIPGDALAQVVRRLVAIRLG